MATFLRVGLCLASLLIPASLCGAQDQYCPATITTKQTVERAPSGWTVGQSKEPHFLDGITFFDGPPEEEASLVYDSYKKSKAADVAVWRFDERSHIWISCAFSGTRVTLAKALLAGTSKCTVTYSPDVHTDGNNEIKDVGCK